MGDPAYPAEEVIQDSGSEDCLILNIFTPRNTTNLPVLVWIHGGGYGQGKWEPEPRANHSENNKCAVHSNPQFSA